MEASTEFVQTRQEYLYKFEQHKAGPSNIITFSSFGSETDREPVQQYFTSDEIMNSILSSPDLALSPGGKTRSRSRGRLVKKNKPPPTSTTRPKTATGPGTVSTYTSSRPSTSTSEYVTANSSATSLNTAPYTKEPLPLPKISDFERRSLTGKRQGADSGPLPPPIKITPLGQAAGGSFPPTPPGSYSGSSAGELTTTLLPTSRTGISPSRFVENISPPFAREEKETVTRPSSAGSLFGRRKSKERVPKERDTTTFFGRDGELGDIGVQSDVPDVQSRSFFRGRSHSRSMSHSGGRSNVAPNGGILVNSPSAILAIPPTPEMEARHPAHRSPPPPGTVATTTITTTTTHYHLMGQNAEEQSFLPPLHLPQLELTFEGTNFPSSRRPVSSAPALPSPEWRNADMGGYRGSGSESSNSSKEELGSNSSRQVLQESKSDKRPKGPIKPAPLFSGTNRENREKRGGPPISFYNSSQELYHPHLRQEKTSSVGSGTHGEKIPENSPEPRVAEPRVAEPSGAPPTPMRSLTRGGYNDKAIDRRRSYSENGKVRDTQRVDVEEVFRDIEATKNGGKGRENRGSGFVTIGGGESIASSNRSSKQEELFIELEKRVDMGKEKEQGKATEVPKSEQTAPASPTLPKPQSEVSVGCKEPEVVTQIEPGFVFPFAQAVTVDEPVQLLSTNHSSVYRTQSNPLTPTSVDMAINEAYRPTPEIRSSHEEVARPKTAPSTGTASKPVGLGIGRETDKGFVGGWKLDTMRKFNLDSTKSAAATLPTHPTHHIQASATSSNPSSSAITPLGSADVPNAGHSRKFSYQTIEGMALVEEGKMGNGKEVKLADLQVVEKGGQQKQQKQEPGDRPQYIPFRPVTIIEPKTSARPGASPEVVVLADGSTLPAPVSVGSPRKARSRAESPHWEPMVPVDRSKNKREEKDEKRKSKRWWFGSYRKSKEVEGGNKNRDSGLGSGLSNASSSSRSSKGSSKSGVTQQPIPPPSTSGSDGSVTPPGSSASNTSSILGGKAGSAPELPRGAAEFPYTSKKVAAVAAAAHPAGPPHPLGRPSTSGQFPLHAATPVTAIPTSSRGRARTRESGLRYEVHGETSLLSVDSNKEAAGSLIAKGKSPAPQHRRNPSSPSVSRPGSSGTGSGPKPLGKLFVVCCNCEYWHDLPSQMYYEMHEMACSVNCVYCLHKMEVKCCSGYSCAVYVLEKHHGK